MSMADKALLMGVNDYLSISKLNGCLEDVDNMRRLLSEQYRFPESGFRELRDHEVLRREVEDGFDWLFRDARAGDRLVVHFSGHGSYMEGGRDEPSDELICLADMDWSDPKSYFTDDELSDITQRLPEGAHLTIVLDCCHSGTGTRSLAGLMGGMGLTATVRRSLETNLSALPISRDALVIVEALPAGLETLTRLVDGARRSRDAQSLETLQGMAEGMICARFAPPPGWREGERTDPRRPRKRRSELDMNHLLLAGAKDEQTAADAFIDGRAQGAFTYNLCRAARRGPERATRVIFEEARAAMQGKFTQIPQLEGPFKESPLFAPGRSGADPVAPPVSPVSAVVPGSSMRPDAQIAGAPVGDPVADLIRVHEKFLDTLRQLLTERSTTAAARAAATATVVYVHGIGGHGEGFSNSWWKALEPHLAGRVFKKAEVVWSDLVNADRSTLSRGEARSIDRAYGAIEAELRQRIEEERAALGEVAEGEAERGLVTDHISLDDFPRYLLVQSIRDDAIGRFRAVLEPLLAAGGPVHVISHSWGTVVAYEALRRLERESQPAGRVGRFFTVGSALSFRSVRALLEKGAKDDAKPALVDYWINLDAEQDVVGGKLGSMAVDRDALGLEAVGCRWGWRPVCAHSSYFHPANHKVNRDIFAAEILGH
jgi:pimeloyl-ACP methyl ester carboxylesterase